MFRRLWQSKILFWKLTRVVGQIIYGTWKLALVPRPIVTIFGGAHLTQDDPYAKLATEVATKLVSKNISVITGGGSGIMQAASCILPQKGKAKIIGIGVKSIKEEKNECVKDFFLLDYLFARKGLMINSANAFVVFPGGFGTLDELMEVITLISTKEIAPLPIILVGKNYWESFMQWANTYTVAAGFVEKAQIDLMVLSDDPDYIVALIERHCQNDKCELR